jgi:hypothetical protein
MSISILTARLNNAQRAYDTLKQALRELDFVRPGSVVKRYMPCGKPSCRCMGQPPRLHGPYYQWSHKLRSKTVTMRVTPEQAKLCQQWVENHRRLKDIVRRMETLSLKETDRLLRKLS